MAITTLSGTLPTSVTAAGVRNYTTGDAVSAAGLQADLGDAYAPAMYCLPSGVVLGFACTASGLGVTIPAGSVWYARQVWLVTTDTVVTVPDNSTTYLWGCSDGVIRQTSTTTAPTGYSAYTAAIVAQVSASGGVATVAAYKQWAMGSSIVPVPGGLTSITGALPDADYTVLPAQYAGEVILVAHTGWTATHNLIMPIAVGMLRWIVNTCGQSVVVKGATGTGPTIATARAACAVCDGTNWLRLTADSVLT
jgi:hypothetical protein